MSLPVKPCAVFCALALLALPLGACNVLGGSSGVMPESEVGLPPSMRGAVKGAAPTHTGAVDDDGRPINANPSRQLALPKTLKGETRSADAGGSRRIDREDLEGADTGGRRGGSGLAPSMTPGGGVGLGGKF